MTPEEPRPADPSFHFFYGYPAPPGSVVVRMLGVEYLHLKTDNDGGDLYLTRFGIPFLENLRPENWYARDWFPSNREKLQGTSTVYRVRTRPARGGRSKDIVVKWCRVGEEVPADTFMLHQFVNAEFNTPYEEFALVHELRDNRVGGLLRTHKPLGIYVPSERLQEWQTGRSTSKMARKKAQFRDVELDICRQYIMIYEWIKGVSVFEACRDRLAPDALKEALDDASGQVNRKLEEKGYRVLDMKPVHVIVRKDAEGGLLRDRRGRLAWALVDFELLERTPEHEERIQARRRADYLKRQSGRFFVSHREDFPPHLHFINIFGVDYVYGSTESTQGIVWVAGKDPGLFDYFLPERWRRTGRTKLSPTREIYHTRTKDNIHLVWKVSSVGDLPETPEAAEHGFNSPFEEFALALELSNRGLRTIFPRAIYMTGKKRSGECAPQDRRRFDSHGSILIHDGATVLRPDHNYITVWGYWVGPISEEARQDEIYNKGVNLWDGFQAGLVDEATYGRLMERKRTLLAQAGFEDLKMKGDHLLLSVNAEGGLLLDKQGLPDVRLCNFEFIRRLR